MYVIPMTIDPRAAKGREADMTATSVMLVDTTLRDGQQSNGIGLSVSEKLLLAHQLDHLGIDVIECGNPMESEDDHKAVESIAKEVKRPIVSALARCYVPDIERAWSALAPAVKPRLHLFIPSSDTQILHQLRRSPEQTLDMAIHAIEAAVRYTTDVQFTPIDALRTNIEFLVVMIESAINAGASTISIADTTGYATPSEISERVATIIQAVDNIEAATLGIHCHNDLGMATANSIEAVENGARQVEGSIVGLGERAGCASLDEVATAIRLRKDRVNVHTAIRHDRIYPTARLIYHATGTPNPRHKPVVGRMAYTHHSPIHQDGVLRNPETFEIINPRSVGMPVGESNSIDPDASFASEMEERGFFVRPDTARDFAERARVVATNRRALAPDELAALYVDQRRAEGVPAAYTLRSCRIDHGADGPNAVVSLELADLAEPLTDSATGLSAHHAAFTAINRIANLPLKLVSYDTRKLAEGIDSLTEANVLVEYDRTLFMGGAVALNDLEAAANAYLNAINRICASGERSPRSYDQTP